MSHGGAVSIPRPFEKSADAPARSATAASSIAAVVTIGAAAMGLRLLFGPQFDGLDDAGYLDAAQRVSDGRPLDTLFALFRTRVGMSYPLGAMLHGGWLEAGQFWILTFAAEAITIVSLIAAGRLLTGGAGAGLAAAGLYAIYPLAVQQAAMYYPTAFQVASIAAACALMLAAERREGAGRSAFALAAGVSLGIGYLFKEDVAIVVIAIAVASLVARYPRLTTAAFACGGAAIVFFSECAVYWWSTGDALHRLRATSGMGAPVPGGLQIVEIWGMDAYLRSLLLMPVQVGVMWWAALAALWWTWRSRHVAAVRFIAVLFVIVMAYLQFGSGSFSSYSPLPKTPRYTALATPLLMLITGAWLAALISARRRRGLAIAAVIAVVAVPCIFYLNVSSSERTRNTIAVLPILNRLPPAPLYTDFYSARVLRLIVPGRDIQVWYHANFKTNEPVVQADPSTHRGAYVLADRQAAKVYTSSYEMTLPPQIEEIPPEWQVVWTNRAYPDGSMTRVVLEGFRTVAGWLPSGNPLSSRATRNLADMIDGDQATLYRVP